MRRGRRGHRPEGAQITRGEPGELAVGQERGPLADLPVHLSPCGRVGRGGAVHAADGVERVLAIAVTAVLVAALVVVGQQQQVVGVGAALQTEQTTGEVLPVLRGVERVDGAGDRVGVAQSARVGGGCRSGHQRVDQLVIAGDELGRVGTQRAGRGSGAVGRVVVERNLEAGHLFDQRLQRILGGVDRPVQHHGANPVGEPLEVGRAQFGPVAVAQIIDLILAQGRADSVHILCRRSGSDAGQEWLTHPVQTLLGEAAADLFDGRHSGGAVVDHRFTSPRVALSVGAAPQFRRGVPHPAGVEADQVEVFGDGTVGQRFRQVGHRVHRRGAGAARVHQQYADALAAGRDADHCQVCLGANGIGGVDGDRHRGALGGGQVGVGDEAFAAAPHRRRGLAQVRGCDGRRDDPRCDEHRGGYHQRAQDRGERRRARPTRAFHGRNRGMPATANPARDDHTSVSEPQRF